MEIAKQRDKYSKLKLQYLDVNLNSEEMDPALNNPLSLDSSSPWNKFFENEHLKKLILQDVEVR